MAAAFEVDDVHYAYGDIGALHGVTLAIPSGKRVALLGANGSGKSTLLRLLAGLNFPASGSIRFLGGMLSKARLDEEEFFFGFRRRVGVVFQNPDVQLFNASVFDEVAFGPLQMGWPALRVRARVEETLRQMRIDELKDRAPHRLSGGEKKRVAIASVLVLDPDVLILDEPTTALDPASQTQIVELLASWKDSGRTVVIATHDLDALEDVADSCYLLKDGRVAGAGDPLEILHNVGLLESAGLIRPHRHTHGHVHVVEFNSAKLRRAVCGQDD
jgi:cobalt/nickel transport system ATP-binding protein